MLSQVAPGVAIYAVLDSLDRLADRNTACWTKAELEGLHLVTDCDTKNAKAQIEGAFPEGS